MKKISTLVLLLLVVLTGSAQPVSRQEAMDRAVQFLQSAPAQGSTRRAMTTTPQLNEVATGLNHLYVFNVDGGGYVITSGDERAVSVLGYSTTGTLDWQHMPENMRYWLQGYNEAIAKIAQSNLPAAAPRQRAARPAIQPMVTCPWSQDPVFNDDCPMYTGQAAAGKDKRCVTGCTATAIAQVMYYHKWPTAATTAIPAYEYEVSNVQEGLKEKFTLPELPATTFDWANMRDKYLDASGAVLSDVTAAQRKAVATLMRYVGQMLNMSYSPEISLSFHDPAVELMPKYFNYDKGIRSIFRYDYTIDEWENTIYNELAAKRPVVYGGMSGAGGGHTFVCDGYDGQGLFHINWGWAGDGDNYFSLSVLDAKSYSQNVSAGNDFNLSQTALIGIQKENGGTGLSLPELKMPMFPYTITEDKEKYYINLDLIYFSAANPTATFEVDLFEKKGEQWEQFTLGGEPVNLKTGVDGTYTFTYYKSTNDPDCQKNLYVRYRYKGTDNKYGDWTLLTKSQYIEYKVSNKKLTLTGYPVLNQTNFKMADAKVTRGTGELKTTCEITLSVENKGVEFNGAFTLIPYFIGNDKAEDAYKLIDDDNPKATYVKYNTLSVGAFLRANSTTSVKFIFTPNDEGTYLFLLYDKAQPENDLGYFYMDFPAEVTGIESLTPDSSPKGEGSRYYDLQGRKWSNGQLSKGVYITNGKKHVVR